MYNALMVSLWAGLPFAALILAIAIFPLLPHRAEVWWEKNRSKLIVSILFALIVLLYYGLRGSGVEIGRRHSTPGWHSVITVMHFSLIDEYLPFIILLFALYTISGGIRITGDLAGHPSTNTFILFLGAILANLIGTTGASMLLIRPLLQINSERRHTRHIVIFFIFIVSNIAGSLLPIGPPLFLGYLLGVPFLWTVTHLWLRTAICIGLLLAIHFIWDSIEHRRETVRDLIHDEIERVPFGFLGMINLIWIALAVLAVATIVPHHPWLKTNWTPFPYLRELILLAMMGLSCWTTPPGLRAANKFTFYPIVEVACLFLGIFVTLVPLIEWLNQSNFTLTHPWQYFWATGSLSAILDNAPTYLVFFALAAHSTGALVGPGLILPDGRPIAISLLAAVSCGSVFFGGLTYIGNAPNFLVKRLAEDAGVRMPGFFRFTLYGLAVLLPIFGLITLLFFR